jgi:polysaccharide deacetylase 2 family uncharacterized protein YibQ
VPSAGEIDRALVRLEKTAPNAVGIANAVPASIGRITAWTKAAGSRGLLAVPITALVVRGKTSSSATI